VTRKFSCFILLCCLHCVILCANGSLHATLLQRLKTAPADTARVNLLCELSGKSDGAEQLDYAREALDLAGQLNYRYGMARAHILMGEYYYFSEDFPLSIKHCLAGLNLARTDNHNVLSAIAYRYIGYNHFKTQPHTSLQFYQQSMRYSREANNSIQESYALSAIGNLYEAWQNGKKALEYYLRSLAIREKLGTPDQLVSSLIETARAYDRLEDYTVSNEYILRALKIAEEKGSSSQNLIYLYQMVGHDLVAQQEYEKALEYFLKAYNLAAANNGFNQNNISSVRPVADMYLQLGRYKEASEFYKRYFDLLEASQRKLNQQLFESQQAIQQEMDRQKMLLKDAELAKEKAETQRQTILRNLFIVGYLILLALAFFIYRSFRLNRRINSLLEKMVKEKTAELEKTNRKLLLSEMRLRETNQDLEAFIYKASHDLKGPLVSSLSLVDMAQEQKPEDLRPYFDMLRTSLNKLDSILVSLHEVAIIRQGTVVMKKIDLQETLHRMVESFRAYSHFDRIRFTIENRLTRPFYTDEILLHTILRNILENAIKYSRDADPSLIDISLQEEGSYTVISVRDNGIGIPADLRPRVFDVFFRATEKSKGSGLGLYIVKNAMDKLNGRIEIAGEEGQPGITFRLLFPRENQEQ